MRTSSLFAVVTAAAAGVVAQDAVSAGPATGSLGNATVVTNNPPGQVYVATLPDTAFDKDAFPNGGNIKGEVAAVASPNGIGVVFTVKFSNLPKGLGPFPYHIHDAPVPDNGNCTATLAHLDPFLRGEDPACNSNLPQTCQVGDLAGKHGKINSDPFEATFTDEFASTLSGIGAFFGNRSIVVHFPNKTRITCANFKLVAGTANLPTTNSTSTNGTYSASATPSSGAAQPTGAGSGTLNPSQTLTTVSAASLVSAASWSLGAASLFAAIMFML